MGKTGNGSSQKLVGRCSIILVGSRREYLAADKLKIYNAVKLSSVTDAYPGPDLDARPKFNVAIIYEDSAAGKRAKHFYDRVIRELLDECDFSVELWNFQVLTVPEIGDSAAKAAAQADFVILSMHRKAQLSVRTRDWIERPVAKGGFRPCGRHKTRVDNCFTGAI